MLISAQWLKFTFVKGPGEHPSASLADTFWDPYYCVGCLPATVYDVNRELKFGFCFILIDKQLKAFSTSIKKSTRAIGIMCIFSLSRRGLRVCRIPQGSSCSCKDPPLLPPPGWHSLSSFLIQPYDVVNIKCNIGGKSCVVGFFTLSFSGLL